LKSNRLRYTSCLVADVKNTWEGWAQTS
jgi:hypothetical protein